jgi:hypothetical protein|tara:strand:+ start:563 stop:889 length:327 start_codon:yes stop_codon:yes gene_type:complete
MPINHPKERTEVFECNLISHRKKSIKDFTSVKEHSDLLEDFSKIPFTYETIEHSFNKRPDMFANKVYGTPHLWWWLVMFNNMTNPATEFITNKIIKVPTVVPDSKGGL